MYPKTRSSSNKELNLVCTKGFCVSVQVSARCSTSPLHPSSHPSVLDVGGWGGGRAITPCNDFPSHISDKGPKLKFNVIRASLYSPPLTSWPTYHLIAYPPRHVEAVHFKGRRRSHLRANLMELNSPPRPSCSEFLATVSSVGSRARLFE